MNACDVILVGRFLYYVCYIGHLKRLKSEGQYPFKLGFGFTTTCIKIVYENTMKAGAN